MSDTTQHTPADVREQVKGAWATVEAAALAQANVLDSHYGGQRARAAEIRNAVEQVAALLRTPRGEGEAEVVARLNELSYEVRENPLLDAGAVSDELATMADTLAALTPRGEGCRTVDETYCATHDCGAHDDEKCGRPGCQHCDAQTVGDRHRLSRQLLALASVIEGGGKPSNSVADDVRRAASALVYTPPPRAMRQVTDRMASLLDSDYHLVARRWEKMRDDLRHTLGDVEALAVEVIRLNTALALLKTEENAAHVETVATNAAWLEELERIAAFATRTPALRPDAALCSEAQGEEDAVRRTWELAVRRAYGCLDYCGGYHGAELKAFHSGIKTVIRALEAGLDTVDTQTAALDRIGAARQGEGGE